MEWIFLVGWYYIYISIPETSKWSNFERGIIGLSKKHLPFFHFDEGWGWMSLLKTSLKKKKLLITIILSCWGWCLKSPPFWASPHSPEHHRKPSDREAVPFCHGSVLCSWMVWAPKCRLQNHHQRMEKKKRLRCKLAFPNGLRFYLQLLHIITLTSVKVYLSYAWLRTILCRQTSSA